MSHRPVCIHGIHVLYKELCGVNESRSVHVFGILSLVCGLRSLAPLPEHKFIYRGWEGSLLGTLFFVVFRSTAWHFKRPDPSTKCVCNSRILEFSLR